MSLLENVFSCHSGLDPESIRCCFKMDSGFRRNDKNGDSLLFHQTPNSQSPSRNFLSPFSSLIDYF